MNSLSLSEPDAVDKFIALILGLPGRILSQVFSLVENTGHPVRAETQYLCLIVLAVGALIICYRYRRHFIAWFIGLYALLITISAVLAATVPIWQQIFSPTVRLTGSIIVLQRTISDQPETISGDWRSNDCGIDQSRQVQRCSAKSTKIYPPFNLHVDSANCGSNVENVKEDPSNAQCILVSERLQGCGYNKILGIKDCKGRGWLSYSVLTSVKAENLKEIGRQNVDLQTKFASPIIVNIATPNEIDKANLLFKYVVQLTSQDGKPISLTNEKPSNDVVQSSIVGDDLVISQSAEAIDKKSSTIH